jgi:hypothetical protein
MSRLLHFYRYTFYWGYEWSLRKYGKSRNAPEITGVAVSSLALLLNALTIAFMAKWLLHLKSVPMNLPKEQMLIALIIFFAPHYWYLVHSKRYLMIAAEFDAWDADRRWYMNRRVIGYIFVSFATWGLSIYLGRNYPNPLHLPW